MIDVYKSKAAIAYSILKEKIISGEYNYGQVLSANALSEEFGMSRTPILEALKMLENEEIVNVIPQVGVIVKPINPLSLIGKFTMQGLMEGYMAGKLAKSDNIQPKNELVELLEKMDQCIPDNNVAEYAELNRKFHNLIMDSAEEPYIKDAVLQIYNQNRYINMRAVLFDNNMSHSLGEHRNIVTAIMQQDEMKTRILMEEHILKRRKEYLEKLMKK
jgi:DNA-binding GntR family transcriptional regulator